VPFSEFKVEIDLEIQWTGQKELAILKIMGKVDSQDE